MAVFNKMRWLKENEEQLALSAKLARPTHGGSIKDTLSPDETEFMLAMDLFKRHFQKPYPSSREVLTVLHTLGYRKM